MLLDSITESGPVSPFDSVMGMGQMYLYGSITEMSQVCSLDSIMESGPVI
jgi:hypothetical protein